VEWGPSGWIEYDSCATVLIGFTKDNLSHLNNVKSFSNMDSTKKKKKKKDTFKSSFHYYYFRSGTFKTKNTQHSKTRVNKQYVVPTSKFWHPALKQMSTARCIKASLILVLTKGGSTAKELRQRNSFIYRGLFPVLSTASAKAESLIGLHLFILNP